MGSRVVRACWWLCLLVFLARAEDRAPARWLDVEFPRDSPLGLVGYAVDESREHGRGISQVVAVRSSVTLRNLGSKPIRGLTLLIEAQNLSPSGRGSVTLPSLNVQPGEAFPVRLDLELTRTATLEQAVTSLVKISLDCVLFDDLSAYGANKLDGRRNLTVYELEARRDRRYYQQLLRDGQTAQLREEMQFGLSDLRPPQLGLQLLQKSRPVQRGEQSVHVGAIVFPDAPVQPLSGAARLYANEVRAPQVEVKNTSNKAIRLIEMGWILRDDKGRSFIAGAMPWSVELGPIQRRQFNEEGVLKFSQSSGQPMLVNGVSAFISTVEFANGDLWIPSRRDLSQANLDPALRRAICLSPEQQRLADLYHKQGLSALASELKKFN